MAKGLYESINNSLDNLVRSITPTEKKKVTGTKNINESVSLVEKKVPDEDVKDNEIIKNIINKREKRVNAKLTPEEKEVYDKYGLETQTGEYDWDRGGTRVGDRVIRSTDTYRTQKGKKKQDVNFVDMARKAPERRERIRGTGFDRAIRGLEGSREDKLEKGAPDGSYGQNNLTKERRLRRSSLKRPYWSVEDHLDKKKDAEKRLASTDSDFDKYANLYKAEIEQARRKLADNDKRREQAKKDRQDDIDYEKGKIDQIINQFRRKKDKNESASRKRQRRIVESVAKRRRLIEKAVPEEDRYENDLIKSIINKRANRSNAKLEPAEQAVANKYGITTDRFNSGVKTRVGRRNIPYAYSGKGYDDINYVDMARKGPERINKAHETGIDVVDRRFSGIEGSREGKKNEPYSRNALRQSRDRLNRVMQRDYKEVSDRANTKKYYKGVLDNVDKEFDKRRDDYLAKINSLTKEIADNDKYREEKRAYNKKVIDNITNDQKAIIDKHRKNKNESFKKNRKRK